MKAKSPAISLTWLGHSAFHLRTPGGVSILIDPWLANPSAPHPTWKRPAVDLILITHGHSDHLGEAAAIARETKATVLAIFEISTYLAGKGVTTGVALNKGGSYSTGGILVSMVDAKHSSSIDDGGTFLPGGEAAGYVIACEDGRSVYHAGDTCVFSDMALIAKLYKPEIAILPIGDLFTMGPREAAIACSFLKPKTIVGMHYGTFPALSGTPTELRKYLTPQMRKRVIELVPGEPRTL